MSTIRNAVRGRGWSGCELPHRSRLAEEFRGNAPSQPEDFQAGGSSRGVEHDHRAGFSAANFSRAAASSVAA
jgi:hypothetical protein